MRGDGTLSKGAGTTSGKGGARVRRSARSTGRKPKKGAALRPRGRGAASRKRVASSPTFPKLRWQDGCAAMLMIAERVGGVWEHVTHRCEVQMPGTGASSRAAGGRLPRISRRTCQALAAFGHPQRLKIMAKLLEGPATYRSLQKVTKLKAGPLYHHISQLRLAGLILPKQRDLYALTRGGRNLILMAAVLGPLIRDGRRRPVAGED